MAATCEVAGCDTLLQQLTRDLNGLRDEDRNVRKRSLLEIQNATQQLQTNFSSDSIHQIFHHLHKPLLKCITDPVEKCRELSLQILVTLWTLDEQGGHFILPYLMPCIVQRIGQQDVHENSEEIRLQIVQLLLMVVQRGGPKVLPYFNDVVDILKRSIVDPYPEVKKESCKCASELALALPSHFHMQSESVVAPLLQTLTHQHAKVRIIAIEAIGDVVQYGNNKSVSDVVSHLAQRLFDYSPLVRSAVIRVVGRWLVELPDRYSYFYRLIPLILSSLLDENPENRQLANDLWLGAGTLFEKENEEEFKDELDYREQDPQHYPPNYCRPNLGCRKLIYRNFSTILPSLLNDIEDWVLETRVKAVQLLHMLLLNGEDAITQHISRIFHALQVACGDNQHEVVVEAQKASEIIGYFVSPLIYSSLMLQNIKSSPSTRNLCIMASIVRGTEKTKLLTVVEEICSTVAQPEICQDSEAGYQTQLLNLVEAVLIVCNKSDCRRVASELFQILFTVYALSSEEAIREKSKALQEQLCCELGFNELSELYDTHLHCILDRLVTNQNCWVSSSSERFIFDAVLCCGGSTLGKHLDVLIPMLCANLTPDKDPQMRLRFFTSLSNLLLHVTETLDSTNQFKSFITAIIHDVIIPNLVWHAGRSASALRTAAISCLWALFQNKNISNDQLLPCFDKLLPQLISLLEDDSQTTRTIDCRVLKEAFVICRGHVHLDSLHNLYSELLKRLDDASDEIRMLAISMLDAYFDCFDGQFNAELYQAHLEDIYDVLLVHMDDKDSQLQDGVCALLEKVGRESPKHLEEKIREARIKHRNHKYCDQLLEYLKNLKVDD